MTLDFHPALNRVGSPGRPLGWGCKNTALSCNLPYCYTDKEVKVDYQDYLLNVLITTLVNRFSFTLTARWPKQGYHHDFARDKNPLSTTYALDCACVPSYERKSRHPFFQQGGISVGSSGGRGRLESRVVRQRLTHR